MQIPQILSLADLQVDRNFAVIRCGEQLFGLEEGALSAELYAQWVGSSQSFEARGLKGIETVLHQAERFLLPLDQSKGLDALEHVRLTAAKLFKHAVARKSPDLSFAFSSLSIEQLGALLDGLFYAQYRFDLYKSKKESPVLPEIFVYLPQELLAEAKTLVDEKLILAQSTAQIRDFVNTPGGDLVPSDYAERIAELFASDPQVQVEILDEVQLEAQGYMGLITVGRGSQNPPRMVSISYNAQLNDGEHLGFVGKGMTFDAGGISIKPATGMWEMRMDMAGSAAVVGAMLAISRLKLPVRVSAVVVLAENRPGENACLPGDIFKAKNGKTVMVDNTDAEGRLVLSDGLFKVGEMGATTLVDLATLTGAIIRAIGTSIAGLFSNDRSLECELLEAGKLHGEKMWPMPLDLEYRDSLDDKVADMKNIGGDAGAVTAALFLQEFIPENAKWAHLDIAGTAFCTKDWKYYGAGGTGWGVRTLVQWAKNKSGGLK